MGPRLLWTALLHASGVALSFQVQHLVDAWGDAHTEITTHNDLGLHFLGTPLLHLPWLPDLLLFVHAPVLLLALLYESAEHAGEDSAPAAKPGHSHARPHSKRIRGWISARWRGRLSVFLLCHAVIMYMRISTIVSTVSLRSHRCARGKDNPAELLNGNCHDMMFSGHASVQFLCALFVSRSELPLLVRVGSLCLGVFGAIVNILVGDHYTVDIVVAGWFCVLVSTLIRSHFRAVFASHRELHPHEHAAERVSLPKHEAKLPAHKTCGCECHSTGAADRSSHDSLRRRANSHTAELDASGALKYDPEWEVSE